MDFQWKMSFNPDPNKQSQEIIYLYKEIHEYTSPYTNI